MKFSSNFVGFLIIKACAPQVFFSLATALFYQGSLRIKTHSTFNMNETFLRNFLNTSERIFLDPTLQNGLHFFFYKQLGSGLSPQSCWYFVSKLQFCSLDSSAGWVFFTAERKLLMIRDCSRANKKWMYENPNQIFSTFNGVWPAAILMSFTFFVGARKVLMRLNVLIFWKFSATKFRFFLIFYETFLRVNEKSYSWC